MIPAPGHKRKCATQVDGDLLSNPRALAQKEGRQIQSLFEEAVLDLIEKRQHERPRAHVMSAYQESHERFAPLYRQLAEWPLRKTSAR